MAGFQLPPGGGITGGMKPGVIQPAPQTGGFNLNVGPQSSAAGRTTLAEQGYGWSPATTASPSGVQVTPLAPKPQPTQSPSMAGLSAAAQQSYSLQNPGMSAGGGGGGEAFDDYTGGAKVAMPTAPTPSTSGAGDGGMGVGDSAIDRIIGAQQGASMQGLMRQGLGQRDYPQSAANFGKRAY